MLWHALLALGTTTALPAAQETAQPDFECGFVTPAEHREALDRAIRLGLIEDRRLSPLPAVAPRSRGVSAVGIPCLTTAQIHPYEDTAGVLLTDYEEGELYDLMADAANELMTTYGDNFDFIGYWVNFTPDHTIGAAFYMPIENDVMGIGDASTVGTPIFNDRPNLGLAGDNVEGYIMMWDINSFWQPGSGPSADFTRLVLGQEFEHRFGLFLPDLLDGRGMQPNTGGCGRTFHWNWQVDAQGSGMEVSEWVGVNPAVPNTNGNFNTDIPGGVFSYPDLYLMGYVTGNEMDMLASELRIMDTADCSSNYSGTISTFTSADIIASAGPRVPDLTTAQKHWRTGWVMIHQPGDAPDSAELTKTVGILQQHMLDWNHSTLGRGTMDNTLFDECNTVTAYGCGVNPTASLTVTDGLPEIGRTITYGVDNPLGTQPAGSLAILSFSLAPDANFPCGTVLGNFGMSGGPGELLISLAKANKIARLSGTWTGSGTPVEFPISIPADVALTGESFFAQGLILDPTVALGVKFGLTDALESVIGP
jgi:hypothetical protein